MARKDCPLREDAGKVIRLGDEIVKSIRRLRIKMRQCDECPDYIDCPLIDEWNAAIDQAVTEINEEWGLI
jgi:hypothetical protein